MKKDEKLKIGFIGVGGMGQCAHLRNYSILEDCEIVAIAEVKENLGKTVGERYGISKVYTSYGDMLNNETLDALVCAQPFTRHGILITDLAKYGLPIFTEKPLASSIATGESILKALKKNNCKHMVGYHKRSDPAVEYAVNEINELKKTKELGELKYVRLLMPAGDWTANGMDIRIDIQDPNPDFEFDKPSVDMDNKTSEEYISFVNYYIHQVNLMRFLLGEDYEVTHADPSGVLLVGKSSSGIPCTLEMSPYETTIDWQESALVAFEKGYIKIKLDAPLTCNRAGEVEVLKDAGDKIPTTTCPQMPMVHAMKNQAQNFINFAKGITPAPCEAEEALEDLKVARQYIKLLTGK